VHHRYSKQPQVNAVAPRLSRSYLQIVPSRFKLGAEVPEELAVREVVKCVQLGVGQQAYLLDVVGEGAVAGACAVFYVRLSAYTVSIGKGRERW
jgi:hypothetical protein